MNRKRDFCGWAILAAALLLILMCACGGRTDAPSFNRKQLNAELGKLRELGLFHAEFEVSRKDKAVRNEHFETGEFGRGDSGDAVIYVDDSLFYCTLHIDTGTGKLTGLSINAKRQDDWEPAYSTDSVDIYDNYDVIMDRSLTIGQYCDIWAEYQGYDYYKLPEGVTLSTRYLDADGLDAYEFTHEGNGICIPFFRDGEEAAAGYAWVSYAPTGTGPNVVFGAAALKG